MRNLRILYAGSPLASSMVLKRLLAGAADGGWEVCAVLTNPPSARGRHKELVPTEVARTAEAAGIPVLAFDHLRTESRQAVAPLGADLLVCFDYGRIFGEKFLALFPLGGINLHPSALPRYRGCTPVPAALLAGDAELGISVQKLALETDSGDILARAALPLTGAETTLSLMDGDGTQSPVTDAGAQLLAAVLRKIVQTAADGADSAESAPHASADNDVANGGAGAVAPCAENVAGAIVGTATATDVASAVSAPAGDCNTDGAGVASPAPVSAASRAASSARCPFSLPAGTPQTGAASYTPFIAKEDGRIDWTQPAASIDRKIRAYTPWPLCFTSANGVQLLILTARPAPDRTDAPAGTVLPYRKAVGVEIACGGGTVLVTTELQWQAKKAMDYKSFMNGARNFVGSVLG